MGRSILAVLLATILTISRVFINPAPSTCQLLFIIFAPHRRRRRGKGEGVGDTELTWATLSSSDCNNLTVTEVRCQLNPDSGCCCGATMSVGDRTLDALLDHLRDLDLPTILARLADRSEP